MAPLLIASAYVPARFEILNCDFEPRIRSEAAFPPSTATYRDRPPPTTTTYPDPAPRPHRPRRDRDRDRHVFLSIIAELAIHGWLADCFYRGHAASCLVGTGLPKYPG